MQLDLIGCHGQTLYHQSRPARYAGRSFACTWQAGEPAALAAATRRPRGLQLPPRRHVRRRPGSAARSAPRLRSLRRPETGPRAAEHRRHRQPHRHSRGGATRRRNRLRHRPRQHGHRRAGPAALQQALRPQRRPRRARHRARNPFFATALRNPYFRLPPPRTAGREQFGREYAAEFLHELPQAQPPSPKTPSPPPPRSPPNPSREAIGDSSFRNMKNQPSTTSSPAAARATAL